MDFLSIFQAVRPIGKTRNQLKCKWQSEGIHSGVRCQEELAREECCGKAQLGFDSSFSWKPDWNLRFSTKAIYPAGNLSRYLIGKTLDDLSISVDKELNKQGEVRPKILDVWNQMASPIPLGDGAWLVIDPRDAWITPVEIQGDLVGFSLGLSALPRIEYGGYSNGENKTIPPLNMRASRGGEIVIAMHGKLPFQDASRLLHERLKTMELPTRLGPVHILDVNIYGLNKTLVIGVKVDSPLLFDWVYFTGDLEYRSINYTFIVRNLRLYVTNGVSL